MQLNNKKELASRVLGIGKKRIIFNKEALEDVKEALTKQDIKDLIDIDDKKNFLYGTFLPFFRG